MAVVLHLLSSLQQTCSTPQTVLVEDRLGSTQAISPFATGCKLAVVAAFILLRIAAMSREGYCG